MFAGKAYGDLLFKYWPGHYTVKLPIEALSVSTAGQATGRGHHATYILHV